MQKKGIDISRYQGTPDFAKLKNEVDFVIIQAGFGKYSSQVDSQFERNYAECKKYGIPCGAYWFSYASTPVEAMYEAVACNDVIKGKQFEYPIYFDIEGNACDYQTADKCKYFCNELEKRGWFTGIYISRSPAQQFLDEYCRKNYALWLAEYNSQLNWTGDVGIWQYSSTGRYNGINGNVDSNFCYVDYPSIIKKAGLNNFDPEPNTNEDVLDKSGFKEGDKNDGVLAYKQLLILARERGTIDQKVDNNSSFGPGTTKATNEVLGLLGEIQNGIAGPNLIKALGEKLRTEYK